MSHLHLIIGNSAEVGAMFGDLGQRVGPRKGPDRRTNFEKETFNLRHYLTTLADHSLLSYPLEVTKSESPDFMLGDPATGGRGLEVTEATTESFQRELTKTEGAGTILPKGPGWAGNMPERECCAAILRAVKHKSRAVGQPGYLPANRYDLLVYATNVRAFFYNDTEVASLLAVKVQRWTGSWNRSSKLGEVSVITHHHLLYNITAELRMLPLSNPACAR